MEKYSNDEFLLKMFGFMGKENFKRFIDITTECCDKNEMKFCDINNCGECYCNHVRRVEKELTGE